MKPLIATTPRRKLVALLPCLAAVAVGIAMLFMTKGPRHYRPPTFAGFEPRLTQEAAIEIVQTGRTAMTFHPTGYSYFAALVYFCLPDDAWRVPLAILIMQIACLPLVSWCVGRIAAEFGDPRLEPWGRWAAALYYPLGYYASTFNNTFATLLFSSVAIAGFLPLLGPDRSLCRSLLVGLALGAVACLRPNFAFFGVVFALALWQATRSLREAMIRSAPIAIMSFAMLATMTAINPPEPGQFVRGSQGMNISLLKGTFQYSHTWWDWDWDWDPNDPGHRDFCADRDRIIEAETGKPATNMDAEEVAAAMSPATQLAIRREAWSRIIGLPGNTLKKVLISTVRVWILIPTQLNSMAAKMLIAAQEFLLLGLALCGLWLMNRRPGLRLLAIGVLAVPTVSHWLLHVEPRYSLPAKGVELALAVVAFVALARRLKIVKSESCSAPPVRG